MVIGIDRLLETTGAGMARAQGYPSLRMAMLPFSARAWGGSASDVELRRSAELAAPQVVRILTIEV